MLHFNTILKKTDRITISACVFSPELSPVFPFRFAFRRGTGRCRGDSCGPAARSRR